jgi:hypothetical protein
MAHITTHTNRRFRSHTQPQPPSAKIGSPVQAQPNPIYAPETQSKEKEKRKPQKFPIRCPAIRGARLPDRSKLRLPLTEAGAKTPHQTPLKTHQTVAARRFEPAGAGAGAFSPRGGGAGRNPSDGGVRGLGGGGGAPRCGLRGG